MNEPQLSAEMADTYIDPTKQIEKILVDMEKHYCRLNGQDDGYLVKKATMRKLLATALEEQRAKVLREVYDLMNESDGVAGLHLNGEVATWDWLLDHGWLPTVAKLNQLKGNHD